MCKNCHNELTHQIKGKLFCSETCRMDWHEKRSREGKELFDILHKKGWQKIWEEPIPD